MFDLTTLNHYKLYNLIVELKRSEQPDNLDEYVPVSKLVLDQIYELVFGEGYQYNDHEPININVEKLKEKIEQETEEELLECFYAGVEED